MTAEQKTEWVLVPRVPTQEMLSAAGRLQACECGFVGGVSPMDGEEYAAMLAAAPPPPADAEARAVLEKAQWGLYVAWDAVAALEDLQKRGVYVPRCADGRPSRADAGKDLEVIKAVYETVKAHLSQQPEPKAEARGVVGELVEIGDDNDGQPRLLIHTTREAIRDGNLRPFQAVEVREDLTAALTESRNGR